MQPPNRNDELPESQMPTLLFPEPAIPPQWQERVRAELRDGERLVWVGHPRPGLPVLVSLASWGMGFAFVGSGFGFIAISAIVFAVLFLVHGAGPGRLLWIFLAAGALPIL